MWVTVFCLKKLTAIFLVGLLSFNWFGYKLVIGYFQKQADRRLESRIDINDYDESQLMEIKVALDMPYQTNWSEFERHYGEIEVGGNIYTYVKRKVEDGFLILKCIPNAAKQKINNADDRIFNTNNGLDQEHNTTKKDAPLNTVNKSIFSIYDDYSANYNLVPLLNSGILLFSAGTHSLENISLPVAEQPPEAI